MKHLYSILIYLAACIGLPGKSQLLNENFNAGLPVWTQSPAATWSTSSNLGTSGSGCIFTQEPGSASVTTTIFTPTLNLSSVTNLTISFKASSVANNFVGPNVILSYDAGSGPQFLARWGSGFSSNTTYTLLYSTDYQPPLDAQNMNLSTCAHTVSSVNGNTIRFIFEAEFVNGGYVVLDDIVIAGIAPLTTALNTSQEEGSVLLFPNPVTNTKMMLEGVNIKSIAMTDNLGRNVDAGQIRTSETGTEIDLSGRTAGIYYLHITTFKNTFIRKKIVLN